MFFSQDSLIIIIITSHQPQTRLEPRRSHLLQIFLSSPSVALREFRHTINDGEKIALQMACQHLTRSSPSLFEDEWKCVFTTWSRSFLYSGSQVTFNYHMSRFSMHSAPTDCFVTATDTYASLFCIPIELQPHPQVHRHSFRRNSGCCSMGVENTGGSTIRIARTLIVTTRSNHVE